MFEDYNPIWEKEYEITEEMYNIQCAEIIKDEYFWEVNYGDN